MARQDAFDLSSVAVGGLIREDVMQKIFDLSHIILPFTSRIGTAGHSAPYAEWPADRLQEPAANAVIDGSSARADESFEPTSGRIGNHSQISTKTVKTSTRANAVNTIGFARAMAYQLSQRGDELRRDVEMIAMSNQSSVADTGDGGVAGQSAGLEAWVDDTDVIGGSMFDATAGNSSQYRDLSTGGIGIGGWTNRTGNAITDIDYSSVTAVAALTEESIKDVVEGLYLRGADPTLLMARPPVIRRLSEFQFTSAARIATLTNQDNAGSQGQRIAQGSVNVMVTDFSVLELVANRLMRQSNKTGLDGDSTPLSDTVLIVDPSQLALSFLTGYRTVTEGKNGLLDEREIQVDWTLKPGSYEAIGAIFGVDDAAAVTAS